MVLRNSLVDDIASIIFVIAAAKALLVSEQSIFLGKNTRVRILVHRKKVERKEDQLTGF